MTLYILLDSAFGSCVVVSVRQQKVFVIFSSLIKVFLDYIIFTNAIRYPRNLREG